MQWFEKASLFSLSLIYHQFWEGGRLDPPVFSLTSDRRAHDFLTAIILKTV